MTEDDRRKRHDDARGKKRSSLADLSKALPSDEHLASYQDLLASESDRGAAIMAGALVEQALEVAVRARIVDLGPTIMKSWFEGPSAPFSSFSAKIKLGRALGIYAEKMDKRLTTVKDIRNAFAHCSVPLDFDNPTIRQACEVIAQEEPSDLSARLTYVIACEFLSRALISFGFNEGGKEIKVVYR